MRRITWKSLVNIKIIESN
ncbi:unnamed protein product [Lathyrus oleraceus]